MMQKVEYQNNLTNKRTKFIQKHHETIEDLEKLLEKGVPDLTMSDCFKIKISLRTLYEIVYKDCFINDNG